MPCGQPRLLLSRVCQLPSPDGSEEMATEEAWLMGRLEVLHGLLNGLKAE